ncbi:adenosine deaminase [Propionibacteriaceae bacterium Y2011]
MLDAELIRSLPKVALHDHLDGGLRPGTIIDLAPNGHELPSTDPTALGEWFVAAADSGSLERYLTTFDHTIAVLQTADNLRRVAREFVEDMVADNVIHAETRWAPEQHLRDGLTMDEAVEAVQAGIDDGVRDAAAAGHVISVRQLITAMRHGDRAVEVAGLALRHRRAGVGGFDIAGGELGNPPGRHLAAFRLLREANFPYTIHAGEADGLSSIWEAVQVCHANRIGHGVRLIDDITSDEAGTPVPGDLAAYVRDLRIPLELCPSSNLQTGVAATIAEHPFDRLVRAGMRVTVNCDNRLQSGTTLTREFGLLVDAFGYDLADLERFTVAAARSAFLPYPQRQQLITEVIRPAFAAAARSTAPQPHSPR